VNNNKCRCRLLQVYTACFVLYLEACRQLQADISGAFVMFNMNDIEIETDGKSSSDVDSDGLT
jgi:hypothetical protein